MTKDYNHQANMFETEKLPEAKGKTLEALAYSRQKRDELVRMFRGQVPESVMLADKTSAEEADLATGTYTASGQLARKRAAGEVIETGSDAFEISGRGGAAGALSKFPQNIGRAVVLLYTKPYDVIVDPFAGHNSRMELCVKELRHYYGQDLSHNFMDFNRERADYLRAKFPEVTIQLKEGPSQTFQYPDCVGDFTLTSPPYYDIEIYGDEPEQLGNMPTYEQFIEQMSIIAKENFRVLKPGAFCVYFINDFRRKGRFIPYHIDTFNFLVKAGFVPWDMLISDLGRTFRSAFVAQIVEQRILPKRHEYGVIMRKPGWK